MPQPTCPPRGAMFCGCSMSTPRLTLTFSTTTCATAMRAVHYSRCNTEPRHRRATWKVLKWPWRARPGCQAKQDVSESWVARTLVPAGQSQESPGMELNSMPQTRWWPVGRYGQRQAALSYRAR